MFERFTDESRRAIALTQDEVRTIRHDEVAVEHLLAGLLRVGGVAHRVLKEAGVELEAVRSKITEKREPSDEPPASALPFTSGLKEVLELALREALGLGHSYIGTEHLLLALLREGGRGAEILADLDSTADVDEWRKRVLRAIAGAARRAVMSAPDAADAATTVTDGHLLDRIAAFAKRTGATISISYPREH
jgi:ATP-dependent Clp protease ATP-binding subunit ClpC